MSWNCFLKLPGSASTRSISKRVRWARTASISLALALACSACSAKAPPSTYRPAVVPGIDQRQLEAAIGRPSSTLPFALPGIAAQILSYPFGQVATRNGTVITVTIAGDPSFVGPYGSHIGMAEDQLASALKASGKHIKGHHDSYDVIAGDMVTRTKDAYDDTDHVMFELAAANPNDPEAPYSIVSINLADANGFAFLQALTQAKESGVY